MTIHTSDFDCTHGWIIYGLVGFPPERASVPPQGCLKFMSSLIFSFCFFCSLSVQAVLFGGGLKGGRRGKKEIQKLSSILCPIACLLFQLFAACLHNSGRAFVCCFLAFRLFWEIQFFFSFYTWKWVGQVHFHWCILPIQNSWLWKEWTALGCPQLPTQWWNLPDWHQRSEASLDV